MGLFELSTLQRDVPILYCVYCLLVNMLPTKQLVFLYLLAVALVVAILDRKPSPHPSTGTRVRLRTLNLRTSHQQVSSQQVQCEQLLHAHNVALSHISTFLVGRSDFMHLIGTTLRSTKVVAIPVRHDDQTILMQPMPVQRKTRAASFHIRINLEPEADGHCVRYYAWDRNGRSLMGAVQIDRLCFIPRYESDNVTPVDEVYYQYFCV